MSEEVAEKETTCSKALSPECPFCVGSESERLSCPSWAIAYTNNELRNINENLFEEIRVLKGAMNSCAVREHIDEILGDDDDECEKGSTGEIQRLIPVYNVGG